MNCFDNLFILFKDVSDALFSDSFLNLIDSNLSISKCCTTCHEIC